MKNAVCTVISDEIVENKGALTAKLNCSPTRTVKAKREADADGIVATLGKTDATADAVKLAEGLVEAEKDGV